MHVPEIVWVGDSKPTPEQLEQCRAEIAQLDLSEPSDLVFHDAWLHGEPGDPDHVSAIIRGVEGETSLFGQMSE